MSVIDKQTYEAFRAGLAKQGISRDEIRRGRFSLIVGEWATEEDDFGPNVDIRSGFIGLRKAMQAAAKVPDETPVSLCHVLSGRYVRV